MAIGVDVKQEPAFSHQTVPSSQHIACLENSFLAPYTHLLLSAAECRCGFTGETLAFFQQ